MDKHLDVTPKNTLILGVQMLLKTLYLLWSTMAESIRRTLELSTEQSFFLFGARGTGKSTLLKQHPHLLKGIYLDFLRPSLEERYSLNPELLLSQATTLKSDQWII